MPVDVRRDHLAIIRSVLKLLVPSYRVLAFGSRVKHTARDTSDLDLCVIGNERLSTAVLVDLRDEFSQSNLPYKVDVVDWAAITPDFQKVIMKNCFEIQSADTKQIWSNKRLSEAVNFNPAVKLIRGKDYPFVDMSKIEPGKKFIEASEVRPFSGDGSRFEDGDTLIARITPYLENGKIAMYRAAKGTSVAHGSFEFIVCRARAGVTDNQYVYYLLTSPEVKSFAISQMTGQAGRQRVPLSAFNHIAISLLPLVEQKAIAALLSNLDDKIELNGKMNETLNIAKLRDLLLPKLLSGELRVKEAERMIEALTADTY
jgi:type I restriction enzyme S subunit